MSLLLGDRYFRGPKTLKQSWGGKLNSVLLVHDKQMCFMVQYREVSVLALRNVHVDDMNFISV